MHICSYKCIYYSFKMKLSSQCDILNSSKEINEGFSKEILLLIECCSYNKDLKAYGVCQQKEELFTLAKETSRAIFVRDHSPVLLYMLAQVQGYDQEK